MRPVIIAVLLTAFLYPGCAQQGSQQIQQPGGMDVDINGGDGQFPEFIVGKWKSDTQGWVFNFEPDGKISSAVVSMGRTWMEPGKVRHVPMKFGKKGEFVPGDWEVYYDHETRELMVKIVIKHFFMEMGNDVLEGKSEDIFVGEISEDGTTWKVASQSFPYYVAHFPDKPDFDMSMKPDSPQQYDLVFRKIQPEESEQGIKQK